MKASSRGTMTKESLASHWAWGGHGGWGVGAEHTEARSGKQGSTANAWSVRPWVPSLALNKTKTTPQCVLSTREPGCEGRGQTVRNKGHLLDTQDTCPWRDRAGRQ